MKQDKPPNIEWTVACKEVSIISLADDMGNPRIHIEAYANGGGIDMSPAEARELLLGALLHLGAGKSERDVDPTTSYALELCHFHMMARDRMEKEMGELHSRIATLSLKLGEARGELKKHQ